FSAAHDVAYLNCYLSTGHANLLQVVCLSCKLSGRLRARDSHVAKIAHFVAEFRYTLIQSRDAKRSRAKVHASKLRAETKRYAQDAYAPTRARMIRRQNERLL